METLEIVKILERRDFNHDEAINLATAINGRSGLATKEDLNEAEIRLKEDIGKVKEDINRIEAELANKATKEDLSKVEAGLKDDISKVKKDIVRVEAELANKATKEDLSKVESSLKQDIARLGTSTSLIMALLIPSFVALLTIAIKQFVG